MLTQSSPLNTVEVYCPSAMDDELLEIHMEMKYDFVTFPNVVFFHSDIFFFRIEKVAVSMYVNKKLYYINALDLQKIFNFT